MTTVSVASVQGNLGKGRITGAQKRRPAPPYGPTWLGEDHAFYVTCSRPLDRVQNWRCDRQTDGQTDGPPM